MPKLPYPIIANFVLEFVDREDSKALKKILTSHLQERIEFFSAFTTSTASGTTNARRSIREHLKSHLSFNYHQGLELQPCSNKQ